jgi:uncharacterized membrane protein YfcA
LFDLIIFVAAIVAGAVAGLAGFGIGSILTPVLALHAGTKLAVALVSIPHVIGTAARVIALRGYIDRKILWSFGVLSAAGGLLGALLNARSQNPLLTLVFGVLLLFAGIANVTTFAQRMRFGPKTAWVAGGVSGFFGGLVGNQGGIRSAALLGFAIPKESFVATATAIGLIVDGARMPVYVATQGSEMLQWVVPVMIATAGVLAGTFGGVKLLRRIPQQTFRQFVGALIALLGLYMLARGSAELSWI